MQLLLQAHSGSPLSPRLGIDLTCSRYSIGFSSIDIIHSLLFFISLNVPILRELHLLALHYCGMWAIGFWLGHLYCQTTVILKASHHMFLVLLLYLTCDGFGLL